MNWMVHEPESPTASQPQSGQTEQKKHGNALLTVFRQLPWQTEDLLGWVAQAIGDSPGGSTNWDFVDSALLKNHKTVANKISEENYR